MIYTSVFTIISLLFGVHFYKSRYPQDFDTVILNISANIQQNETLKPFLPFLTSLAYYTIYVYSFCQILFLKTMNVCVPYINLVVKRIFNAISKPGIELKTETLQNVKELNSTILTPLDTVDGNLVLIKSSTNDVIILDKMPESLDNLKYEVSDIRFLAIHFSFNLPFSGTEMTELDPLLCASSMRKGVNHNVSENHIIDLYNNEANYYVVGNKLDIKFFNYYLRNVLNVKIDNDTPFEYKLELMDHNVNMVYVNEKESIVIEKDGYKIINGTEISEEAKVEVSEPKVEVSEPKVEVNEAKVEVSEAKDYTKI